LKMWQRLALELNAMCKKDLQKHEHQDIEKLPLLKNSNQRQRPEHDQHRSLRDM